MSFLLLPTFKKFVLPLQLRSSIIKFFFVCFFFCMGPGTSSSSSVSRPVKHLCVQSVCKLNRLVDYVNCSVVVCLYMYVYIADIVNLYILKNISMPCSFFQNQRIDYCTDNTCMNQLMFVLWDKYSLCSSYLNVKFILRSVRVSWSYGYTWRNWFLLKPHHHWNCTFSSIYFMLLFSCSKKII